MKITANTLKGHSNLAERMARAYEAEGVTDAATHFRKEAKRIAKMADEMQDPSDYREPEPAAVDWADVFAYATGKK